MEKTRNFPLIRKFLQRGFVRFLEGGNFGLVSVKMQSGSFLLLDFTLHFLQFCFQRSFLVDNLRQKIHPIKITDQENGDNHNRYFGFRGQLLDVIYRNRHN
ncbi:MAG: hypothetical protein BWY69_01088 [Planctomycetes bacterium ADurb.Bin401]|nr:MAG: hypothetical protein BWY69_01088 [Planctomycetes bacterium ADurb.Bin401]